VLCLTFLSKTVFGTVFPIGKSLKSKKKCEIKIKENGEPSKLQSSPLLPPPLSLYPLNSFSFSTIDWHRYCHLIEIGSPNSEKNGLHPTLNILRVEVLNNHNVISLFLNGKYLIHILQGSSEKPHGCCFGNTVEEKLLPPPPALPPPINPPPILCLPFHPFSPLEG